MRVLFIGCVRSSELFLNKLLQMKADIVGVVTKAEAGINADFVDIGQICEKNQLDYIYVKNINEPESKTYIQQKKPALILCLGWSQLLDEEILKIPAEGCIGFHPAKLPYNRGRVNLGTGAWTGKYGIYFLLYGCTCRHGRDCITAGTSYIL